MPDIVIKPGEMRHYLSALSKTNTKAPGGSLVSSWQYSFSFYAQDDTTKSMESFSGTLPGNRTTVTFSTWHRDDIKRDMRIRWEEEEYEIIGMNKGFSGMSIECKKVE